MSRHTDDAPLAIDRRSDILERATEAFLSHGYSGASMAILAKAVGIQKASLYHHYPSKQALFIACVTEGYDGAARRLEAIRADPELEDAEKLRQGIEELYRINLTTPVGRMAPLIAEVSPAIPEVARAFHGGFISRSYLAINGIIQDGISRGGFVPIDALGMQHLVFGPIITLALSREMTASFEDRDSLYPVPQIMASHIDLILRLLTTKVDRTA